MKDKKLSFVPNLNLNKLLQKKLIIITFTYIEYVYFFIEFIAINFNCLILQRGLIVGVYIDDSGDNVTLTPAAAQINQESDGAIAKALKM